MSDDREHPDPHLVTVYETSDPDLVPIIRGILRGADIPFTFGGESMIHLLPTETMMPVLTDHDGELVVQVPADRAEEARALLSEDFEIVSPEDQAALATGGDARDGDGEDGDSEEE